jgi:hypothetical protein
MKKGNTGMSLINIKQLRNLPQADPGAIILYDGYSNKWSNLSDFAILFPSGDTSTRPVSAVNGMARYNTSTNYFEFYQNDTWVPLNFINNVIVSSIGGGTNIITGVSGNNEIIARTIVGGGGIEVSAKPNGQIIVSADFNMSSNLEMTITVSQNSHGFTTGNVIYYDPTSSQWKLAIANSANTLGVAIAKINDSNSFEAIFGGVLNGFTDLSAGHYYFVSDVSAGELTSTEPNKYSNPILYAITSTIGMVLPYRPSEVTSGINVSVSSVGSGASLFRNTENEQLIFRTISSSKGINVSVTTNSIFIGLEDDLYEKLKTTIYDKKIFYAENFDNPVSNDWFLNGLAPISSDELNTGLIIRKFYSVSARGVGYLYRFPSLINDNLKMRLRFVVRSVTAPIDGQTAVFRLYYRNITYNSAIPSWNLFNNITLTFSNNNNFQIFEVTYPLSSSPFISDRLYQFELIRDPFGGTLVYDLNLLEYSIEILY